MIMYTIYHNASDYPGVYCVRKWGCRKGKTVPLELVGVQEKLDDARLLIPNTHVRMERSPSDDPCIVETWI